MRKKILLALTLIILAALCLFSCGDEEANQPPSDNSNQSSQVSVSTSANLSVWSSNITGKLSNAVSEINLSEHIFVSGAEGFAFYSDRACENQINGSTVSLLEKDNTFYLKVTNKGQSKVYTINIYRAPIYTLTFNTNGGGSVEPIKVEENKLATAPTTQRSGYTFIGWDFDFSKPVTSNATVTASWQIIEYDITYNLNSGENNSENPTKYTVESADFSIGEPTRKGYTFLGWTTAESSEPQKSLTVRKGSVESINLTANWQINTYNISYDIGDGVLSEANPTTFDVTDLPLYPSSPKKDGLFFGGWYYDEELTQRAYSIDKCENITLYAKYTAATAAESFEFNLIEDENVYYVVEKYIGNETDIYLPDEYNGLPIVCYSSEAFKDNKNILSVSFPSNPLKFRADVFKGCDNLKHVYITDMSTWLKNEFQLSASSSSGFLDSNPLCNGGTLYLNGKPVVDLVIPEGTTHIGDEAFGGCSSIETVTFPESIVSIGSGAFLKCENMRAIYISDLKKWCEIDWDKMDEWDKLNFYAGYHTMHNTTPFTAIGDLYLNGELVTDLVIPDGILTLGGNTFYGCTSIKTVTLNSELQTIHWPFRDCVNLESVDFSKATGLLAIGAGAFKDCESLKEARLPDGIVHISNMAFAGCDALEYVTLPSALTYLGERVFDDAKALSRDEYGVAYIGNWIVEAYNPIIGNHVIIKDGTVGIADNTFFRKETLMSVTIPDSLMYIGSGAFEDCESLSDVIINNKNSKLSVIYEEAFKDCSILSKFDLPDTVTMIKDDAFLGCSKLPEKENGVSYVGKWVCDFDNSASSLELRYGTLGIMQEAFENSNALTAIVIPDSVFYIGPYAFLNCTALESVVLPNNLTELPYGIFYGCTDLWRIKFPDNLKKISTAAFSGCSSIGDVILPDSVVEMGGFSDSGITSLTISSLSHLETVTDNFYYNDSFKAVYVETLEKWLQINANNRNSSDGILTSRLNDQTLYIGGQEVSSVTVPEGTTYIPAYAFNCKNIVNITLPSTIEAIGKSAFNYSLEKVYIPNIDNWYNIDFANNSCPLMYAEELFVDGVTLTSATIPSDMTVIPDYLLSTKYLYTVNLHDNVEVIGSYAFSDTSLTEIVIPKRLKKLCYNAFWDTYIESVYISDLDGWCRVEVEDEDATPMQYAKYLYYNNELLERVDVPSGVTTISYYAFSCQNLKFVSLPDTVRVIQTGAFKNCNNLQGINSDYGIVIPDGVTHIESYAFFNCTLTEKVKIPDTVTSIGWEIFGRMPSLTSLEMPLVGEGLLGRYFDSAYSSDEDATVQYSEYAAEYGSSYTIPLTLTSVTVLGEEIPTLFFNNCTMIKSITLADTVKKIGKFAFDECVGLESVHITDVAAWCSIEFEIDSAPIINYYTANPFVYATDLYLDGQPVTDLVVPDTVKEISAFAFFNCESLESVTLPDTLEKINTSAFEYCNTLKTVFVPWAVTYIAPSAFGSTDITVYYEGTQSMWDQVFQNPDSTITVLFNQKKQ